MPGRHFIRLVILLFGAATGTLFIAQRAVLERAARREAAIVSAPRPSPPEPEESFRLAPDRRVLMAAGDLRHLLTASPRRDADARFDGTLWHVAHDGVEVGTLPEVPDYQDMVALLGAWATRLGVDQVVNAPGITGNRAPLEAELRQIQALRAAALAERRWSVGERGLPLFELGTRALVLLDLGSADRIGASDRLTARALALLAACRAIDPTTLTRESCLLADRMGYGAQARAEARRLDPYDAVRAFVQRNDLRLAALAGQHHAPPETRFLHALRSTGSAARVGSPLAALLAAERDLSAIGAATASDSASRVRPDGRPLALLANDLERLIESVQPVEGGMFLDREVLGGLVRGAFYSALWTAGERERGAPSSAAGAGPGVSPLAGVPPGPAAEFAACARHLADARAGRPDLVALTVDLGALPHFGAPLLMASYEALADGAPADGTPAANLARRRAARRLADRLDSRPAQRAAFGWIAYRDLLALPLAEELVGSAVRAGGSMDCEIEAWWREYTGDRPGLESMLERTALTASEEAAILGHYQVLPGVDSTAACGSFRRSIAAHPESWDLVAGYAAVLERHRAWGAARTSVRRWLDRNADRAGLEGIEARATLARLYEDERRYADGFAVVASAVATQQGDAMACAIRLLDKLGRASQAETLAVFACERAPDYRAAQVQAVELFWRHGKPGPAARLIAARAGANTAAHWRGALGPGFVRCFRDHIAAGVCATDSILATGRVPAGTVSQLASAAADSGAWALAFEVESRVHPRPERRLEHIVDLVRYLGRWKGAGEAGAWLGSRLRGLDATGVAAVERLAFAAGEDGLLWSASPDSSATHRESSWLLRAAAAARRGDHGGEHARDLAWHFAAPGGDRDRTLGRFVLGLEDESRVVALASTPSEKCEVYFFLGFKAQAEGRCREAAQWYSRCLGTHQTARPEFRWAFERLLEWRGLRRSLERIASERVVPAPPRV